MSSPSPLTHMMLSLTSEPLFKILSQPVALSNPVYLDQVPILLAEPFPGVLKVNAQIP